MDNFLAFTLKSTGTLDMLKTDTLVLSDVRDNNKLYIPKSGVDYGIQVHRSLPSLKGL